MSAPPLWHRANRLGGGAYAMEVDVRFYPKVGEDLWVLRRCRFLTRRVAQVWSWSMVGYPAARGDSSLEYEHAGEYAKLSTCRTYAEQAARRGFYWQSGRGWTVDGTTADFPDGVQVVP